MRLFQTKRLKEAKRQSDYWESMYKDEVSTKNTWRRRVEKDHKKEIEKLNDSIDDMNRKHGKEVTSLTDERDNLKDQVSTLIEVGEKAHDLRRRELLLEKRENLLDAKTQALDESKKEVKTLKEEADEKATVEYKKGYADGLSDGIREGLDGTKEANANLANIAMMSAASHTPAAADIVAKGMNNVLPATTRTEDK